MSADPGNPKVSKQDARDVRRAAALRENLRRRKSQARARAAEGTGVTRIDGKQTAAQALSTTPSRESEP